MTQIYPVKFLIIGHLSKQFQVLFTKKQYFQASDGIGNEAKKTALKFHRGQEKLQKDWSPEVSLFHPVLEAKITNFHQNHAFSSKGRMPFKIKIQTVQSNMSLKWQLSHGECAISVLPHQLQTALPPYLF